MKVVGYIRVSTEKQVNEGISLDAQESKIKAWAELNDSEIIGIFKDAGISGAKDNREGLNQAISVATEHQAALVVYSLSRLSRSTRLTCEIGDKLDKAGADLVSIFEKIDTTTAAGKMVFRVLAAMAKFEKDKISERTKLALGYKKANGEKTGGDVPFGFDVDDSGRLIKNEKEQTIIKMIFDAWGKGNSLGAIAKKLNNEGYTTKKGNRFFAQTIKNIINYNNSLLKKAD
jgi:site-specific DNA recombinase